MAAAGGVGVKFGGGVDRTGWFLATDLTFVFAGAAGAGVAGGVAGAAVAGTGVPGGVAAAGGVAGAFGSVTGGVGGSGAGSISSVAGFGSMSSNMRLWRYDGSSGSVVGGSSPAAGAGGSSPVGGSTTTAGAVGGTGGVPAGAGSGDRRASKRRPRMDRSIESSRLFVSVYNCGGGCCCCCGWGVPAAACPCMAWATIAPAWGLIFPMISNKAEIAW